MVLVVKNLPANAGNTPTTSGLAEARSPWSVGCPLPWVPGHPPSLPAESQADGPGVDLGSYQLGSWAHELSHVWAPNRTPCDEMPQPTHGCPLVQAQCCGRNVGAAEPESQTEAPRTRVSGREVLGKGRSPRGHEGWGRGSGETTASDSAAVLLAAAHVAGENRFRAGLSPVEEG